MTMYRVTATLSQRELIDYLDANGSIDVKIETIREAGQEDNLGTSIPVRGPRRKRTSKVNETILAALEYAAPNALSASALKSSLSKVGLSENSLSTGLALLQKDGKVERTDTGSYALASAA